jgi:predicted ribosomally synthesized peptide with nif11-like leader
MTMSNAEFERFNADLAADPELQEAAKTAATGLASLVAFAKERGYNVTLEDATAYLKARAPQLMSSEEMDAIAGGSAPDGVVIASTSASGIVISAVQTQGVLTTVISLNAQAQVAQIVVAEAVCGSAVSVT